MPEKENLPAHVGIIMDGNGRWAKKRGLPRKMGHRAGAEAFKNIVRYANKLGISYLTMYVFSTENWKRPREEVSAIMGLLRDYLGQVEKYKNENIRMRFLGDTSVFDEDIQEKMERVRLQSEENTGMLLNLAINYGGRSEILHGAKLLGEKLQSGAISGDQVTEELFSNLLYTAGEPDVDLLIRPSGEYRLSNFLLWQAAYAEFVFMDQILWPDFKPKHLDEALLEYQKRSRRFGGI